MKKAPLIFILLSTLLHAGVGDQGIRNWSLSNSSDSVGCAQVGSWSSVVSGALTCSQGSPPWSVSQSGTWTMGRTWTLSNGTDSIVSFQGTSPWVDNISQFGGNNVVTGTGASGVGIPRITIANDSNILATQSGTWTVTANAGTNLNTSALALAATQTNGTQKTQVVDALGNVAPAGDTVGRASFVKITDGVDTQLITTTGDAQVNDFANTSMVMGNLSVGTSPVQANVSGTNLANRKFLTLYNNSLTTCNYGTSSVTTSGTTQGDVIFSHQFVSLPVGPSVTVYLICGVAAQSIIVKEFS